MKKVLFATTALVLSAGYAAADVSLSGYGRFGLAYNSGAYGEGAANSSHTWVEQRLRLNIKASTQSDSGVEFGGMFRIQYDDGDSSGGAGANAAQFYFTYQGLTVQVGNVTTALDEDTAGLFYATEQNLTEYTPGDSRSAFYTYSSKAYSSSETSRTGVYAKYELDGFRVEGSFIDPNQYGDNGAGVKDEGSLVASYSTGPLTLAAGGTWNGAGYADNNVWYAGAQYKFTEEFDAGLTYIDEGKSVDVGTFGADLGKTITAYGTYTMGPAALTGFVSKYASVDDSLKATDAYKRTTTFGLMGNYDLGGGVSLRASLMKDGYDDTLGEFGVKFKF